eukprot:1669092-Amphidinium_carterae.1
MDDFHVLSPCLVYPIFPFVPLHSFHPLCVVEERRSLFPLVGGLGVLQTSPPKFLNLAFQLTCDARGLPKKALLLTKLVQEEWHNKHTNLFQTSHRGTSS